MKSSIGKSNQIVTLTRELEKKKRELDSLSPTEQFAAYFKTERVYNRLKAEHSQLGKLSFLKRFLVFKLVKYVFIYQLLQRI